MVPLNGDGYRARMKLRACLLLSLVLPVLSACGKKSEPTGGGGESATKVVASCDQREMTGPPVKTCLEYVGKNWTKSEVKARCGGAGQVFLETACPTDGVVLSCVQAQGQPMEAINRYYDQADKAKEICGSIGKPL